MKYDYLIVGAGLYGAVFAQRAVEQGKKVLVIDKRPNIGGNVYTEEKEQQVYCLLDKGRAMQAPFHGMTTLDYAINAILALSCVVLKKGDKAGLLAFSSKMDAFVKADNRQTQLNLINEV